jgi:hypothetical protein
VRARVVAPLVAVVLGLCGGVATALMVPGEENDGSQATDDGSQATDDGSSFADPLDLGIPMAQQGCSGESLLVIGYGDTRSSLSSAVANSPDPGLRYLRTAGSCDTLLGPQGQARPDYVVYRGPYDSRREPCEIRMSGHEGDSFVTVLRSGNEQLVKCLCEIPVRDAPPLFVGMVADQSATLWIRGLQRMFYDDDPEGFPSSALTGIFDQPTSDRVAVFQVNAPGRVTTRGEVDETTWRILTDRLCRNYDY